MPSISVQRSDTATPKADEDLLFITEILGKEYLERKYQYIGLTTEFVFNRVEIVQLASIVRIAQKFKILEDMKQQLLLPSCNYTELLERYVTLAIANEIFNDLYKAHPEVKIYKESNPDWTFETVNGGQRIIEVSAMTLEESIDQAKSVHGMLPIGQLKRLNSRPLYIELLF